MRILVRAQGPACGGRILVRRQVGGETRRESLSNPIVYQALVNWALKYKLAEAGSSEVIDAIHEIRAAHPEFTIDEARTAIRQSQEVNDHPWIDVSQAIDWNRISQEEELASRAIDAAEVVKAALQLGVIKPKDIELYRRPPPDAALAVKREYSARIEELQRQLEEERRRRIAAERGMAEALARIPPTPPARGLLVTPEVQDTIFNAYASALVERGIDIGFAQRAARERSIEILSEISVARNLEEAERIAVETAAGDLMSIRQAEQRPQEVSPRTIVIAPQALPAVRVKVTYSDGRVVWSGIVARKTGEGIQTGTLKEDPGARVEFYPPTTVTPEEGSEGP